MRHASILHWARPRSRDNLEGCFLTLPTGRDIPLERHGKLLTVGVSPVVTGREAAFVTVPSREQQLYELHCKLGHPGIETGAAGIDPNLFPTADEDVDCGECDRHKITAGPINKKPAQRTTDVQRRLIHADIIGPFTESELGRYKYAVVLLDEATRFLRAYPMKHKSEIPDRLQDFYRDAATDREVPLDFKNGPHLLQVDHENVFLTGAVKRVLKDNNSLLQASEPGRHWRNGLVERAIRTVQERTRLLLARSALPQSFWSAALQQATFLYNRSPHTGLGGDGTSPYEKATGNKPDFTGVETFGAPCVVYREKKTRLKHEPHGEEGIYLKKDTVSQGAVVYIPDRKVVRVSADVKFKRLPKPKKTTTWVDPGGGQVQDGEGVATVLEPAESMGAVTHTTVGDEAGTPGQTLETPGVTGGNSTEEIVSTSEGSSTEEIVSSSEGSSTEEIVSSSDEEFAGDEQATVATAALTQGDAGAALLGMKLPGEDIPTTMEEARGRPDYPLWAEALERELQQQMERGVYDPITQEDISNGENVIRMTEVLSVKYKPDGTIDKYKVRLCARGDMEKDWARPDRDMTTSPVTSAESFRLMCAVTATHPEWKMTQLDFSQAYTYASLPEDRNVIVKFPVGVMGSTREEPQYARLKRSLYGLADAGRNWYEEVTGALQTFGLKQSTDDACLFTLTKGGAVQLIAVLWVDDLLMAGDPKETLRLVEALRGQYSVTSGPPTTFLGIQINTDRGVIQIGQERAVVDLLKRNRMQECKPKRVIATNHPQMTEKLDEPEVQGKELADRIQQYRALIGSLLHLAVWTRPDLSYVVGMLARHCSNPGKLHMGALKSILRYLQGTRGCQLTYGLTERDNTLIAYSDADFAGDIDGAKSTSAYVIQLNGATVCYQSRKQTIVALSTAEAELIALCECVRAVITVRNRLSEIGHMQPPATAIFVDNQTAIHLVSQPTGGRRTKHFNVRLKFVREQVARGTVSVKYISTDYNMSDLLTKVLTADKTERFRSAVCGYKVLM